MNVYDSTRTLDVLSPLGYCPVTTPEQADLIILNTCHIREKASEKLFSELGRLKLLKEKSGGQKKIVVMGCVAQAEGEEILFRAPFVDIICGPQTYHRLPSLLKSCAENAVIDTSFPLESKFDEFPVEGVQRSISTFVTVQEGCDKFCSFCVVPYTRGAEVSRPVGDIVSETKRLVKQGVREVTLLGQNVNAYHGMGPDRQDWSLARLLYLLADIEDLQRLRYTTSHPCDMKQDLILAHKHISKLMPSLHLPVQSGSNRILKAMNRRHTVESYRDVIDRLRASRPDIALSSDFIVGFPGETEQDFEQTLNLVKDIGYAHAYSFLYSPRPGTPAASKPQLTQQIKKERLQRLQDLLQTQQNDFNRSFIGQHIAVLFDRPGKYPHQWLGRTSYMQAVHIDSPHPLLGQLIEVEILAAHQNSLLSRIPGQSASRPEVVPPSKTHILLDKKVQ